MKTKMITLLWFLAAGITATFAQGKKTDTLKVYGNCGMCKTTIESSLSKKDGVVSKNWDKTTKMMVVTYDPSKITLKQIGEKIAGAGYDNEYAKAPASAYSSLHSCCQYERPEKDK
jgi:copper chaperone CopZ